MSTICTDCNHCENVQLGGVTVRRLCGEHPRTKTVNRVTGVEQWDDGPRSNGMGQPAETAAQAAKPLCVWVRSNAEDDTCPNYAE